MRSTSRLSWTVLQSASWSSPRPPAAWRSRRSRPNSRTPSTGVVVDPAVGMQQFQAREVAHALGVEPEIISKLVPTIMGCYRAFRDLDVTMLEINPLVITKQKAIVALDAKMQFDDNALYRRPQIAA